MPLIAPAVLSGLLFMPAALASGGSAAQPANAAQDPFKTYRDYLGAVRSGIPPTPEALERYLTNEGLRQWRALPSQARPMVESFFYCTEGLHDARLATQSIKGDKATLDVVLVYRHPLTEALHDVPAKVEMVRTTRGWTVASETLKPTAREDWVIQGLRQAGWTEASGAWTGLRGEGMFPDAFAAAAAGTAAAEARDLASGDAHAIAEIRAIIVAEAAYQGMNNGYYDGLACLAGPAACLHQPGLPPMVDAALASSAVRNGYRTRFDAGPAARQRTPEMSPSSIKAYAVWKIPVAGRSGRVLCGDASGIVCAMPDHTAPATQGECPPGCSILK